MNYIASKEDDALEFCEHDLPGRKPMELKR